MQTTQAQTTADTTSKQIMEAATYNAEPICGQGQHIDVKSMSTAHFSLTAAPPGNGTYRTGGGGGGIFINGVGPKPNQDVRGYGNGDGGDSILEYDRVGCVLLSIQPTDMKVSHTTLQTTEPTIPTDPTTSQPATTTGTFSKDFFSQGAVI